MTDDRRLTTAPIPGLIREITIPVSIGMFFNTMYNVVDTWFGGLISTQAQAAMSLSLPVFFIIISIGSGMGTGATALIGSALGAGKRAAARRYAVQGILFGACMSVILAAVGMAAAPWLFRLLGAGDAYFDLCLVYMNILFRGTLFFFLIYMLNAVLNAMGDTRTYRNFLIAGFLMNIGLDPWFIYGGLGVPPMGVAGIALATVVVQVIGTLYLARVVYRTGMMPFKHIRDWVPRLESFKEIAAQGLPAGMNVLTIAIGVFVITYFVGHYGKEAVAAYGIGMRVEQMVLLPVIGFHVTTLTLVAQNHGAGRYDRVAETVRKTTRYGGIMMAVGTLVVWAGAETFMGIFSRDPAVVRIGASYLKIDAWVLYAYVVLFISVAALQGMKKPAFAVYIGVCRQILAPMLVFYLVTRVWHLSVTGIWWGIFGITWTAAGIAFWYSRQVIDKVSTTTAVSAYEHPN